MRALEHAEERPFWLDSPHAPEPAPPLEGATETDLLVVGAGFTGLWAALLAKEEDPSRDVLLLEGAEVASGASGRNGGFVEASLTHGIENGMARWPDEMSELERIARKNFGEIRTAIDRHGIDAGFEEPGLLEVATEPHQLEWVEEEAELARRFGWRADVLDPHAVRTEIDSPTYLGAAWMRDGSALVDPARLAWGLRRAALAAGVRIHERTPVLELARAGAGVAALCAGNAGAAARRAVIATSAFPGLARAIRRYVVPVYDYVLVTEPIGADRLAAIGWRNRQGIADMGNQFHYYRLTPAGDRVLFGGYDAIYHFANGVAPHLERREASFRLLASHLTATFPQLEGVAFSHRWGGAIDTCSRFSVMFGRALGGRAVYAVGYTGLGMAASRFGARTALDLVDGRDTERTRLELVRRRPLPFPPEPLRYAGIQLTRRELARADRNRGRRGLWLRALDRLGMGYDS